MYFIDIHSYIQVISNL